ncbi:MAG: MEDS domain-containing protein [bacterium]
MSVNAFRSGSGPTSDNTSPPDIKQQILELDYGSHTCILYESPLQQQRAAVPFFKQGLQNGDYCHYVVHEQTINEAENLFEEAGVNVQYHEDRGALSFEKAQNVFFRNGSFSVGEMFDFVKETIVEVRNNGFEGFRSTGEMSWIMDLETSRGDIIEYEARLNNLVQNRRVILLCQYNAEKFPAGMVRKILSTHPVAIVEDLVCQNPFYEPPELLLDDADDEQLLQWKIRKLQDYEEEQQKIETMNRRLERALDGKETLLKEVHHRVKNNMQIMSGLLGMERRRSSSEQLKNTLNDCQNRIQAMGLIHKYLHSSENISSTMELQPYVEDLIDRTITSASNGLEQTSVTLETSFETIKMDLDTIIPLGLCVNELTTNALQHGLSTNQPNPEITVELEFLNNNRLQLHFRDNGKGLPEDFSLDDEDSLGLNLIKKLITTQLNGEVEAWSDDGAHFVLTVPLPRQSLVQKH